jgi:hypothetical protein
MSIKRLFGLTVCILTAASFVVSAQGATYSVPLSALSDAITTATDGDTIIITDSATDDVFRRIEERLTIKAAPGQRPILLNDIDIDNGAQGGQFGSNDGGRIQLGDGVDDPGAAHISIDITTGTFTFENLYVAATEEVVRETGWNGVSSDTVITFNDVDINYAGDRQSFAFWWRNDGIINMNRVTMRNGSSGILRGTGEDKNWFNLNNCEILADDSSGRGGFQKIQDGFVYLRADQCVFRGGNAVSFKEGGSSSTITRSALIAMGPTVVNTADFRYEPGWNWYRLEGTEPPSSLLVSGFCLSEGDWQDGETAGNGSSTLSAWTSDTVRGTYVTMDHCDLISSGCALLFQDYNSTNRQVTITNSNLIALNADAVVTASLNAFDSLTLDYCNIHSLGTGPRLGGETGSYTVSNDYDLDPDYTNWQSNNFSYSDSTLATGADDSSAVGIGSSLAGLVPVELSTFTLQ